MRVFRSGAGLQGGRTRAGTFFIFLVLIVISLFMALPFIYSILQSVKPMHELFAFPPRFFVRNPTVENYTKLLHVGSSTTIPMGRAVVNSVFVTLAGTVVYLVIASMAAYPLALCEFRGRNAINRVVVGALLFTGAVLGTSQYLILAWTRLLNRYAAMLVPTLAAPLGLFLMRQFMTQMIPKAAMEAAKIDGAGHFQIYARIVMPVVKPAWLTLMIFTFQSLWSGSGSGYVYDEALKVLPTVLGQIAAEGIARAGVGAASAVVLMIPPIVLFLYAQTHVVETMATSGIK